MRISRSSPVCPSNSFACRSTLATYASVSGPRNRTAIGVEPNALRAERAGVAPPTPARSRLSIRCDADEMTLGVGEDAEGDPGNGLGGLDDATPQTLCLVEDCVDVVDADEEQHLILVALKRADRGWERSLHTGIDERVAGVGAVRVRPAEQLREERACRVRIRR